MKKTVKTHSNPISSNEPITEIALNALKSNSNLIIIGDLLIDHTVFVKGSEIYPLPVPGEMAYQVLRRIDIAGGAATTARAINNISEGTTFLWGLLGASPWGTFRNILANSQALDGAKNRIEFRGVQDETDASLTTISRLVEVYKDDTNGERYIRKARFLDYGQTHIPVIRQLAALRYHFQGINKKSPLSCIVLNDLDLGAIQQTTINEVRRFSKQNNIPIILRARRAGKKFSELNADVLVCSLAEWRLLVDEEKTVDYWVTNMHKSIVADDFVRLTFNRFKKIRRYIILVGDEWIDKLYVIQPNGDDLLTNIIQVEGISKKDIARTQQVGVSDVFTGIFAKIISTVGINEDLINSIQITKIGIRAYQRSRWHCVPQFETISREKFGFDDDVVNISKKIYGTFYLPEKRHINLFDAKTEFDGIYTVTKEVRTILHEIKLDLVTKNESILIVASGGSGKSEIAKQIQQNSQELGDNAIKLSELEIKWNWDNPQKTISDLYHACKKKGFDKPFIIVDEALKQPGSKSIKSKGVVLLEQASEFKIRLLLIDAEFGEMVPVCWTVLQRT